MSSRLLAPLDAAFTGDAPGDALPPGPRTNPWTDGQTESDAAAPPTAALLDALWHPGEPHRRADGTATSIPTRPVPSAGGCYPVRTHLVSADGARHVVDPETLRVHRRDPERERAAGWPRDALAPGIPHLVFTVLPGRTFGRYRHRAWPLWIADVAYAVAAVRFLLDAPAAAFLGPSAHLRSFLGMPRAADTGAWARGGLVPEIPLAAIPIPDAARVAPDRRAALRARRSPPLAAFLARAATVTPDREADAVAIASSQAWVRGASAVETWSIAADPAPHRLADALWRSHLEAAAHCYAAALSGSSGTRPVSGFAPIRDRWILHAVASIPVDGGPRA